MVCPHAIRLHAFTNDRWPGGPGALDAERFRELLRRVGLERILPAGEFFSRAEAGLLEPDHVCLTFDGNLRCQFDVALPVLREVGLTAFWFVASATLSPRSPSPLRRRCSRWMDAGHLMRLRDEGHIIGLASHDCPSAMDALPVRAQLRQYRDNCALLMELLGERPVVMAHPNGRYSDETLMLLRMLGIRLGFRPDMRCACFSELEYPRIDQVLLAARLGLGERRAVPLARSGGERIA